MNYISDCRSIPLVLSILLAGLSNCASLADSESSYQSSTLSGEYQNSSMNGHVGESENTRQSSSQAGTANESLGDRNSSSDATHETFNPRLAQPSISGRNMPDTLPPSRRTSDSASGVGKTSTYSDISTGRSSGAISNRSNVPQMKTVTYSWAGNYPRHRNSNLRQYTSRHVDNKYMAQNIHRAASTTR